MEKNKEKQHPPFWKSVRNYFREYCTCTSIHGFRYFGEKRTYFERFWWLIVFCITLGACIYAIYGVYQKWVESPVIVSFATKETPIYSIPFPAITICSETKYVKDKYSHAEVKEKISNGENLTEYEKRLYDYMGMICDDKRTKSYSNKEFFTDDFYKSLEKVSLGTSIFQSCEYRGVFQNCSELFKPIFTDEGICFSFNLLDRSEIFRSNVKHYDNYHKADLLSDDDWNIERGYSETAGLYPYPYRALLSGAKNALTVTLAVSKSNIENDCKSAMQGFRVSLHIPSRIPRPSQEYFRVPLEEVVLAAVHPTMMTTADSVKLYNPRRRECYFSSERYLKYFKVYTANNCKMECLANYTMAHWDVSTFLCHGIILHQFVA
ncbi:hypothetical protein JTB14_028320 [Gonioctena quinquepunctata]|nr:hypothetical protein JTB14_028320 [Gonioctena quinquepunctata]